MATSQQYSRKPSLPVLRSFWIALIAVLFLAAPASSQEVSAEWPSIARQAETIVQRSDSTLFSLNRLREELLSWREKFAAEKDLNAGRLQTIDAQIAALGPVPETVEAPEIAERRDALARQREVLFAPNALAHESFAQADGLLRETDARIGERRNAALRKRSETPLNPTHWPAAVSSLKAAILTFGSDLFVANSGKWQQDNVRQRAPLSLLMVLVGLGLLLRGRKWSDRLAVDTVAPGTEWQPIQTAGFSFLGFILPVAGIASIAWGIFRLDVVGTPSVTVLSAVFGAIFILFFTRWLTSRFFPLHEEQGPLQYDEATRGALRRNSFFLGAGLSLILVIKALFEITDAPAISLGVFLFPIDLFLGGILYRFGTTLRTAELSATAAPRAGRTRRLIGLLCIGVGIATPLLTALGYAAASEALLVPSVLSLATLGVVMLLQRLVSIGWSLRGGQGENERGPLAPVLIGAFFFVLALPLLAIVWGAQASDLREWWVKFQTGFSFGKTTLSPTDFLAFVVIFVVGYLLTRFVQSALRGNVLPRTRLDKGGQNAIVAGVGYVGIILSAVIAITSAGIDLSSLAIVAGALSVGIGFGLQTIVSNFVSGIILLIERPVSEGDWIEVNGQMGYVKNISVRATQIETFDRTDVIIPNADLVSGQVTNWTRGNSVGRLIIPVGVAYGTNVDKVMEILKDIAMSHPMVLHNPMPSVLFQNFGASSLDFEIRAILRDVNFMLSVKSDINTEIAQQFAKEGIEIPFPQQDLWLRNPIPKEGGE